MGRPKKKKLVPGKDRDAAKQKEKETMPTLSNKEIEAASIQEAMDNLSAQEGAKNDAKLAKEQEEEAERLVAKQIKDEMDAKAKEADLAAEKEYRRQKNVVAAAVEEEGDAGSEFIEAKGKGDFVEVVDEAAATQARKDAVAKEFAAATGIDLTEPEPDKVNKRQKADTGKTYNLTKTQTTSRPGEITIPNQRTLQDDYLDVVFLNGGSAVIATVEDEKHAARLGAFIQAEMIAANNVFIRDLMREQANMAAGRFIDRVQFDNE